MEGFLEEAKFESGGALLRAGELRLRVLQRDSLPTHILISKSQGLTCKVEKIILVQT